MGALQVRIEAPPQPLQKKRGSARILDAGTNDVEIRAATCPAERLVPDAGEGVPGAGPARYLRVTAGEFSGRRLGVISAVTEQFCDTCNRMRLSATGRLHSCLARDEELDLRGPLRAGASAADLVALVRRAALDKGKGHEFEASGCGGPRKHMVSIGG